MTKDANDLVECAICKERFPGSEVEPAGVVLGRFSPEFRARHPQWDASGYVCREDRNALRAEYVRDLLEDERGEISEVQRGVIESLRAEDVLASEPPDGDGDATFGERMADAIARFGGSWAFLGLFALVLVAWMLVNGRLIAEPFDPYPFVLLNLVLSCIAAVQAPVILMSQNRQSQRDRERAWSDYRVNLRAELEVRLLSEKVDRLQMHQWQRLMEIQRIQTELIEQLARHRDGRADGGDPADGGRRETRGS